MSEHLAYFATIVRKKRGAESSVYLAPPILLGFIWFCLDLFGRIRLEVVCAGPEQLG
jgi:hypothetical protein